MYLFQVFKVWCLICIYRTVRADNEVERGTPCYNEEGKAQRCIPQFINAAFGLPIEATNTCGQNGPVEFCVQTSTQGAKPGCDWCSSISEHDPSYMLTDYSGNKDSTWWQSETMFEGIQAPNQVNLTLHFGKAFDITFIHIVFKSLRPHSFALFKKTTEDGPWIALQYYSANCTEMYSLPDLNYIRRGEDETKAFCTSEFSDVSPLTNGVIPFATLEGRPSAPEYDIRPEFWEWVSATDIRITLDRLNTFGDEIFKDPKVLKSYFYAISDLSVGARCKCNGHASDCIKSVGQGNAAARFTCRCEHNTAGPDCNECLPFYNDAPWQRASQEDAHECKACNCNGFSRRCYFDKDLYNLTGHGGHCLECSSNRDGPNCERCKLNYFQPTGELACYPCNCNDIGSWNLQCNSEGKCSCKPGVTGDKCDRCDLNFYDFGPSGCKACGCNIAGSYLNQASCDPYTGKCVCKENVEGDQCSKCKPGYFNLDESNEFGCTPCFCFGHSSICQSTPGYSKITLESNFIRGNEKWKAEFVGGHGATVNYNSYVQALEVASPSTEPVYFVASEKFLGDQRASYNHDLSFKLRINDNSAVPSVADIILEGAGRTVSRTIFGQDNNLPGTSLQLYKFKLHENPDYGWQPRLSSREFITLLSNLTAIKIKGTYTPQGVGFLDDVSLESARRGAAGTPAPWVETCTCPENYVGQFCESCAPGTRHEIISGGAFSTCVPCNCNEHAKICDADTGRCICEHNTAGENCDRCARGFYGNALAGTPFDCKVCPCPNRGACTVIGDDDTIVCLECPQGYGGLKCEVCSDGYYGDPTGQNGAIRFCQACDCNSNVDPNAIGNCNRTSGECVKCIHNTGGFHCDQCLPGFYGDALAPGKGNCKPCLCNPLGTLELDSGELNCDQLNGQCKCKSHVIGTNCDECEPGYFDLNSGQGCQSCNCDPVGSLNNTCDIHSGQCHCRPGVTGLRCDSCLIYHYGFSTEGCKPCECDTIGSKSLQCGANGQCPCLDNVEGRRCDRCKENKFDRQRDCIDCPPCYNLVQDAVNIHRANLKSLEQTIVNISTSESIPIDKDFEDRLKTVYNKVEKLSDDAKKATGNNEGKVISGKLNELYKELDEISSASKDIANLTSLAKSIASQSEGNISAAEQIIDHAQKTLAGAEQLLYTEGRSALAKAVNKSTEVGVQNEQMSQIARDARQHVLKLEEEAEKLKGIADSAANISNEAYNKAVEAIQKQKNISTELQILKSRLVFTDEKLKSLTSQINETADQVNVAYNESLTIYGDIYGLSVPTVDVPSIKANAENLTKLANENKQSSDKLLDDNKELLTQVNNEIASAETLLQRSNDQQQIADDLFDDAYSALQRAEEAVKLGDKTLQEAEQTYTTLQGFNNFVQENKDKAKAAVAKIPEIEKLTREAQAKIKKAENTVNQAENDAQNAKATAEDAESKYAKPASEEAQEIKKSAKQTLSDQGKLIPKIDEIKSRVSETSNEINNLKQQASKDHNTISEAKVKVSQAKTNAAEVKKQVQKSVDDINNIVKELANLPDIDDSSLNKLAEKLVNVEKKFNESNIDQELQVIKKARYVQVQQVKLYQEELERLQKEVANLDEIRAALPQGCFKRNTLEV
ncbi:laminin subunit gamma-1 [Planococcus citri]|uniref:laminin subunit gamma-1 n=1 Tax=Planococcus citri TaxID=170843 RepID=UPI0031F8379F